MCDWKPGLPPQDGRRYFVWAPEFLWPEVVLWRDYDDDLKEETGEEGYWAFAESLIDEACDGPEPDKWLAWAPIVPPDFGAIHGR